MNSTTNSEIDVDRLMSAIREAAARRNFELAGISTSHSFSTGSRSQKHTGSKTTTALDLSPQPDLPAADTYHVNDLLQFHGRDFIKNAYQAILHREPDAEGLHHNLELLSSGFFNKIDVLASLRYSDEGKQAGVNVAGLKFPATVRSLERVPFFGYALQSLIALLRLPKLIRNQRQFQEYTLAQQVRIADHVNNVTEHMDESEASTEENLRKQQFALAALANLPTDLSVQQAQLQAVESIIRDDVMGRISGEQEKLRLAEEKLVLTSSQLQDTTRELKDMSETLVETKAELGEQQQLITELKRELLTQQRQLIEGNYQSADELREWDELYAAFENQFRGDSVEVEERLRYYLRFIEKLPRDIQILDLGSGRGDWLELLRKEGFDAQGVELNRVLVEHCRQKDLNIVEREMIAHLRNVRSESLDVITIFHLIEHLDNHTLIRLFNEAKRSLKPGGLFMLETPSPENLVVAACNFWADPTHHKPVYPHTLTFLLKSKGFVDPELQFLHPVEGSPFLGETAGAPELNTWFFGPRDYAVVARKS
jgi:SAM-dependent methyltransferase